MPVKKILALGLPVWNTTDMATNLTKINTRLPVELIRRLRQIAIRERRTLEGLIESCIRAGLAQREEQR